MIVGGKTAVIGGTSASAPAFAGMVSLLNEARFRAGKKQLGFLSPLLYSMDASNFNDITVGSNRISGMGVRLSQGYDCVKGWDPVTGFGTPSFATMLQV